MSAFLVLYFFQSEPGESMESPNAFSIPRTSNTNITFGQFLDRFPAAVGKGKLHYRFRSDDSSCGFLWQDMVDRNDLVPISSGVMTCKILCLDNAAAQKRCSRLRLKSNLNRGEEGAAVAMARRLNQEKKINSNSNIEKENGRNDNGTGKQSVRSTNRYADNDDITEIAEEDSNEEDEDNYQQAPVKNNTRGINNTSQNGNGNTPDSGKAVQGKRSVTTAVSNLLNTDDAPSPSSTSNTNSNTVVRKSRPTTPIVAISKPPPASITSPSKPFVSPSSVSTPISVPVVKQEQDMFHFEADSKIPMKSGSFETDANEPALSREELVHRREAALESKVKVALEFKQELDENLKKEEEELDAARLKHDKNLTTWSTNNKEKRNVRTLLTTMHTVLWTGKGNSWKAISLGDVIEPKQVKLQYRKAMLVVHPDRCSALTTETKFIAKRIFEGINEAYQEFLKKESV